MKFLSGKASRPYLDYSNFLYRNYFANMSSNSNVLRITALDNSDTLYQMSRFEKGSRDSTEDDVVQFQ